MAIAFNDASNEYLLMQGTSAISAPLTLAAWYKSDSLAVSQTLIGVSRAALVSDDFYQLVLSGAVAGDYVWARARQSGSDGIAASSTAYSTGVWQHACGVFASSTSRTVYLNGGNSGTDTTSIDPGPPPYVSVGALYRGGGGFLTAYMSGLIAEAAIWTAALTAQEAAALAAGYSPKLIRPQSLVQYYQMLGNRNPENDLISTGGDGPNYNLNWVNTPTKAEDHPPMKYAAKLPYIYTAAPAAPASNARSFAVVIV